MINAILILILTFIVSDFCNFFFFINLFVYPLYEKTLKKFIDVFYCKSIY